MNTRKPLSCISTKRPARKRLAIALSLVFSGLGTLSLSQTAAAADDYQTIDGVGVTAQALKIDVSTQETPQSVSVISSKTLEEGNIRKLDDSMRYTPGFFSQYGADYDTDWMKMRGFSVTTLIDGHRQFSEGFFQTSVEPFGLESVEIIQGPSSSLFGDSQPGGVVNLVTKKPTKTPQHSVSISGGSNKYVQGGFDFADNATEDGTKRYRIVAMVNREDSFLDGVDKHRVYLAPSFTIDVSDRTSLTFLANYLKEKGKPNSAFFPTMGTLHARNGQYISPSTSYALPTDDLDKDQVNFGWELSHEFNDNLKYKQSANFSYTDMYLNVASVYGSGDYFVGNTPTLDPKPMLSRNVLINDGIEKAVTFDNNLTYTNTSGLFDNLFQLGFDYQWFKNSWGANTPSGLDWGTVDPFNPSIFTPGDASAYELADYWRNKWQFGIYGQAQTIVNEFLLLKVGARWDKVSIDSGSDDSRIIITKDQLDDTHFSWNAGIMLLNDYGISPYVNYSEAFFANASLAYAGFDNKYLYGLTEPTNTKQIEYGLKLTPNWLDGFVNIAFFNLKQDNAMTPSLVNGAPAWTPVSVQKANGIEVQARASVFKHLTFDVSYTYLDKTDGDDEVRTVMTPKHMASGWVSYNFADLGLSGLTLGAGVRYIGSSVGHYVNEQVPDVTLWDAAVSYVFDKHWRIQGTITNIADKEYVQVADYGTAYYGEGRVARATLTYAW
ncbi:TonB-dependent siderophore receptor [Sutterella wadsworthensis]|uniref:TonB-dependent siderophore receptor n=1 Tax=Sutterella wadsworthensis TaxID=40545 RepID=UPI0036F2D952